MGIEYKGDEFLYLVVIPDEAGGKKNYRPYNQTDGSSSIESDAIELKTKDKSGSDYGDVTESVSIEGIHMHGDPCIAYLKKAIRTKKLVEIIEVNTRTLETETGMYMISSFERSRSNGEHATYSLEASLNGEIKEGKLTSASDIPAGAPKAEPAAPPAG